MVYTTAERRRQRKIDEILDQALAIVEQRGLQGLTVAELAKRLDWTVGAMYRYFKSKDQLVAALNGRVITSWTALLDVRLGELEHAPPVERLSAAMSLWIDVAHTRPAEFGLVAVTLADPRNLVEDINDASHVAPMMGLLGRIQGLLHEATTQGALSEGCSLSRSLQLVFAVQGVLQLRKLARFDPVTFDARALATQTCSNLLASWESR